MQLEIISPFPDSVTLEIITRSHAAFRKIVGEINGLAKTDVTTPHLFSASISRIELESDSQKPYILRRIKHSFTIRLETNSGSNLVASEDVVIRFLIGPIEKKDHGVVRLPRSRISSIEDLERDIAVVVRHHYKDLVTLYTSKNQQLF